MSEAKEPNKQVMDVSHPGKTAPPLTSKPVIVTNRTILKDPMVVDTSEEDDKKAEDAPKTPAAKAPVASDIESVEPKEKEVAAKPEHVVQPIAEPVVEDKPADDKPIEEPKKAEPTPEPAKPTEPAPSNQESDDDSDNGAVITDAQIEAEAAAEVARDAQVQKLIDSKKYYVPVNAVEKRRTKRVIALGIVLSIVLALAWVDIALDAGLIDLGSVTPVTHFFSN